MAKTEDARARKFRPFSLLNEIEMYRSQGAKVGENVQIGHGAVLHCESPSDIMMGRNVSVGQNSRLVFGKLRIDDNVTIGENVDIRSDLINIGGNTRIGSNLKVLTPYAFIIGKNSNIGSNDSITCREFQAKEFLQFYSDVTVGEGGKYGVNSRVTIGRACFIGKGCVLNTSEEIVIGDDVGIGQQCMIWTHGGYLSTLDGYPANFRPVRIGSHVWIPARTIILPGVTIGSNVVIGINSLVNKDIPSNCFAAGAPVKILRRDCRYPRKLSEEEQKNLMEGIITRYIPLMKDKEIKGEVLYEPEKNRLALKREKGETFYNLGSMTIDGVTDEESEDLRDFLRRNGIKFFTNRKFESLVPPAFKKFMDATK